MGKRLAVVVVVLAIVGVLVMARRRRTQEAPLSGTRSPEGTGVDYRLSPMLAAYAAPDGGTSCETAYNAFHALDEGAKKNGMPVPWTTLPDRTSFLARCDALPPQEQDCMQPRYAAKNAAVCSPIQSKYEKHNPLWD